MYRHIMNNMHTYKSNPNELQMYSIHTCIYIQICVDTHTYIYTHCIQYDLINIYCT